jgi:hypothetical protein
MEQLKQRQLRILEEIGVLEQRMRALLGCRSSHATVTPSAIQREFDCLETVLTTSTNEKKPEEKKNAQVEEQKEHKRAPANCPEIEADIAKFAGSHS